MNMIVADGVSFQYEYPDEPPLKVLENINLTIEQGSFVALLGHNGCGKSTIAKHFNAMLLPTGGTVLVKEMNTSDEALKYEVRRTVGMVLQNPDNQLVSTIVEEDVAFGPENLGVPPEEIRRRVDDALRAVDMFDYRTHAPHKLSGGQKQRIAIAGIIAMEPECIVLDEPTAMLDPHGRREVLDTVRRLNKERGITIVLITHYMDEAVQADRVVVMDDGAILMDGAPREVFSRVDELRRVELDVPQPTELCHALRGRGLPLPEGVLTAVKREHLIAGPTVGDIIALDVQHNKAGVGPDVPAAGQKLANDGGLAAAGAAGDKDVALPYLIAEAQPERAAPGIAAGQGDFGAVRRDGLCLRLGHLEQHLTPPLSARMLFAVVLPLSSLSAVADGLRSRFRRGGDAAQVHGVVGLEDLVRRLVRGVILDQHLLVAEQLLHARLACGPGVDLGRMVIVALEILFRGRHRRHPGRQLLTLLGRECGLTVAENAVHPVPGVRILVVKGVQHLVEIVLLEALGVDEEGVAVLRAVLARQLLRDDLGGDTARIHGQFVLDVLKACYFFAVQHRAPGAVVHVAHGDLIVVVDSFAFFVSIFHSIVPFLRY